jgi:hypothetical protein
MGTRQDYDDAIRLGAENCRPRAAPRCGLSFTTRAFTATRRARVRAPLPSWRHALRSLRLSAVAAPRPRALNLPPPFPVPGSRFGVPPARRIALWTSPTKLVMESSRVSAPCSIRAQELVRCFFNRPSPVRTARSRKQRRCRPTPVSSSMNAEVAAQSLSRSPAIVACSARTVRWRVRRCRPSARASAVRLLAVQDRPVNAATDASRQQRAGSLLSSRDSDSCFDTHPRLLARVPPARGACWSRSPSIEGITFVDEWNVLISIELVPTLPGRPDGESWQDSAAADQLNRLRALVFPPTRDDHLGCARSEGHRRLPGDP